MSDTTAATGPGPRSTWPLIGRSAELERIARALTPGAPGVVLMAGAGVGKSHLARTSLAAAEERGALGVWVQATRSAATVPLGACAGLIPDDLRSDDPLELMRGVAGALTERAAGRQVVLAVDDAQLLDAASAALVLHLAGTGAGTVLATIRTGEPVPDAVTALWKDTGVDRLPLGDLTTDEVAALTEAMLGGPVEARVAHWVAETSAGNALYARELVRGAADDGAVQETAGLWRLVGRPSVSASLTELVGVRMANLDESGRDVVELLALGEPLRLGELAAAVGDDALTGADAHGVLNVTGPGSDDEVRLAHPLYGETLAAAMPALRGRAVRRRLADIVAARGEPTADDALRIATWRLDAGDEPPADLLSLAGRAALLAGDAELAIRMARLALGRGGGVEVELLLARALNVHSNAEEADAVLEAATERVRQSEDPDLAVRFLEQRVAVLQWGLRRPEAARTLVAAARAWWPTPEWRRRLDPLRLYAASLSADTRETLAGYDDLLADPELPAETRGQIERSRIVALYYAGRVREAFGVAQDLRPTVPLRGTQEEIALIGYALAGAESGEEGEGYARALEETLDAGVRQNDHVAAGIAAHFLASRAYAAGRLVRAERLIAEALIHFDAADAFALQLVARALDIEVAVARDDTDEVLRRYEVVETLLAGAEPLLNQRPFIARARASAMAARGDADGAWRLLLEEAETSSMHLYPVKASQRYWAVLHGAPARRVAGAMRGDLERCDSLLSELYAQHVEGLASRDGTALLEVAEAFGRIERCLLGARAAADAARVFLAEGRQDSARRAAALSRQSLAGSEGAVAPRITGLDERDVGLTKREEQLVELARRGLSNAEIADRLVLSVRTVESHLYRAMGKIGISDRRDL